jgi:LytS/YehU family sensor histidine kinase
MLFVSFLENAFKHGVSYQSKSYIYFELKIQTNNLFCSIKNSKHNAHTSHDDEYMGIGLENIKKSLQLLFNDTYTLNIADNQNSFEVDLTIPL